MVSNFSIFFALHQIRILSILVERLGELSPDYNMPTARVRCKNNEVLFPEENSDTCDDFDGIVHDIERLKYFTYKRNSGIHIFIAISPVSSFKNCFIPTVNLNEVESNSLSTNMHYMMVFILLLLQIAHSLCQLFSWLHNIASEEA